MSEGISKQLADPADNQGTGERAFEWARRFDWERHLTILQSAVMEVARWHERVSSEGTTA